MHVVYYLEEGYLFCFFKSFLLDFVNGPPKICFTFTQPTVRTCSISKSNIAIISNDIHVHFCRRAKFFFSSVVVASSQTSTGVLRQVHRVASRMIINFFNCISPSPPSGSAITCVYRTLTIIRIFISPRGQSNTK